MSFEGREIRTCPRTGRLQVCLHGQWWLGTVVLPDSGTFDRAARALGMSPAAATRGTGHA